jgi:hypothetical protein
MARRDRYDQAAVKYFEEARSLWQQYVPARGQADTVQGELLRAVEKLRDEAQRNGNLNWCGDHVILAGYIRTQLMGSGLFTGNAARQVEQDIDRVLDAERPETSDEPYDRLADRIVEWSHAHPEPVPAISACKESPAAGLPSWPGQPAQHALNHASTAP